MMQTHKTDSESFHCDKSNSDDSLEAFWTIVLFVMSGFSADCEHGSKHILSSCKTLLKQIFSTGFQHSTKRAESKESTRL